MTREAILGAIRAVRLPPSELPDLEDIGFPYPDPIEQFKTVLEAVGGNWVEVGSTHELEEYLRAKFPDAKNRLCDYPRATFDTLGAAAPTDPHGLKDLDLTVVQGEFGVAENGAVWVTADRISHRVAFFCAQHLVLLLDSKEIVHKMHQAYERIDLESQSYGLFISGPSKTADIERCLVIGAHGPRSLTVALV